MRRPALYRVRLSVRRDARNLAARSAAAARRGSADLAPRLAAVGRAPAAGLAAVQALPVSSSRAVCSRMRRSRRSDQCSMYQRSSSIRSCHGSAARPLTCAQPVMPGSTASRPSWRSVYCVDLHPHGRARADQAHLAAQHVDEVRQLVEREAPQQRADARDARIALVDRQPGAHLLGAAHHRAQLEQVEVAAALADPALAVDRRAAALEPDRERRRARAAARSSRSSSAASARSSARFTARAARGRGSGGTAAHRHSLRALPGRRRAPAQPVPQAGRQRGGHEHVVVAEREQAHAAAGERLSAAAASNASCAASVTT